VIANLSSSSTTSTLRCGSAGIGAGCQRAELDDLLIA
jgi:hypothetical protein